MSFFANFKLRQRIGFGFAAVLVLLLGIGGFSYGLLAYLNSDFVEYRGNARASNRLAEIEVDVLMARLNVKDFIIGHDAAKRGEVETYFRQARKLMAEAQEQIVDPERRRLLDAVQTGLDGYVAAFGRVIALDSESRAIQADRLDLSGPAMEKGLTELMRSAKGAGDTDAAYNAGETLRSLMLARLYVQRFGISQDTAHADRVRKEMAVTDVSLTRLASELKDPDRRDLARDASRHFAKYKAAFEDKVLAAQSLVTTIRDELDPTGRAIAHSVDELRTVIRADQDALGPRVVADMAWGTRITLLIVSLGLVLGALLAYGIGRSIIRPIVSITGVMTRLARGDLTVKVPATVARDEVGDMARAVEVFKQNGVERERLLSESEREQIARAEHQARLMTLNAGFRSEVQGLLGDVADTTRRMQASSGLMLSISEDSARRAGSAATASQMASDNVVAVAAATEEMTSSIQEISRQVEEASVTIRAATETASGTSVQVTELVEGARRIGEVVTLIQSIAAQTNLLALNATIEAARAGEAGRGFAVVASEVKELANQTARATEEIGHQITSVQSSTHQAADAMRTVAQTIDRIDGIAQSIAMAVTQQSGVTAEISGNVGQAAIGAQQVSQDIATVTASMASAAGAAGETERAAASVSDCTGQLTTTVDRFLAAVAAA